MASRKKPPPEDEPHVNGVAEPRAAETEAEPPVPEGQPAGAISLGAVEGDVTFVALPGEVGRRLSSVCWSCARQHLSAPLADRAQMDAAMAEALVCACGRPVLWSVGARAAAAAAEAHTATLKVQQAHNAAAMAQARAARQAADAQLRHDVATLLERVNMLETRVAGS